MVDCVKLGKAGIAPAPCTKLSNGVRMVAMTGHVTKVSEHLEGDPCPAGKVGAGAPSGGDGKTGPSPNKLSTPKSDVPRYVTQVCANMDKAILEHLPASALSDWVIVDVDGSMGVPDSGIAFSLRGAE